MARIVISMSGEGRGHAARALALIEMLQTDHQLLVLAPNSVIDFFQDSESNLGNVEFFQLQGLSFRYRSSGRLCYLRSILGSVPFVLNLSSLLELVTNRVQRFAPDLAIADFEPLLPRVARTLGVTCLSLDHQHFLSTVLPSILPQKLRRRLYFLRLSIRMFCPRADAHLVSSFYRYPQRKGTEHYQQCGVLLRRETAISPSSDLGNHLLVYIRRSSSFEWLSRLESIGLPVEVYGSNRRGAFGNVHYHLISPTSFAGHLRTATALITTAGNQLVGEALALGKPVLAVPERGNFEQEINAFFLQQTGMGESCNATQFTSQRLHEFVERLDVYRAETSKFDWIGNRRVMETIAGLLPENRTATTSQFPSAQPTTTYEEAAA